MQADSLMWKQVHDYNLLYHPSLESNKMNSNMEFCYHMLFRFLFL